MTDSDATVQRELTSPAGRPVGSFEPVTVVLDEPEKVSCHALVDSVPTDGLRPGQYTMRAYLPDRRPLGQRTEIAFAITP